MSHYDHKERRVLAIYASIFILLAAGIIFTGYISYKGFEDHFLVQEERQLSSIAELKVDELVDWRNGRLADAEALRQNRVFGSLVQAYFEDPKDELTRNRSRTGWRTIKFIQSMTMCVFWIPRGRRAFPLSLI